MTVFNAAAADDYDQRIFRLVPGYSLAQDIAAAILAERLPEQADILIAGCGTGAELMVLAGGGLSWRFTAIEPSAGMLAVAQAKAKAANLADRVISHNCRLEEAPVIPHDAALSFLVSHFIPDDGAKAAYFSDLAARLKSGAPLLTFDYEAMDLPSGAYLHWLTAHGTPEAVAQAVIERIAANWRPVRGSRLRELLNEAGFTAVQSAVQTLNYRGWLATRR